MAWKAHDAIELVLGCGALLLAGSGWGWQMQVAVLSEACCTAGPGSELRHNHATSFSAQLTHSCRLTLPHHRLPQTGAQFCWRAWAGPCSW